MRLAKKVVVVTGSTTGIGEAIARRVVAEGGRVLVTGRNAERGRALVGELGEAAALHVDDLTDPATPERLVAAAAGAFGRVDSIVNNAALIPDGGIVESDAALFERVFAVNTRAPLLLVRAALPYLRETRGSVVNIGSINAHCGEPGLLLYSMSKGALMTMSRNLGDVLHREHGVRVNQLNAGWVLTANEHDRQIGRGQPQDWIDRLASGRTPLGRPLAPEAIAEAAVYWIGDESRGVSGSVVELEQFPVIGRNYHWER